MMRAAVLEQYGPPENLVLREVPRPACSPDQVLIQVRAAGVNPVDWKIRTGSLRLLYPLRLPAVLGFDVSGRLEEVGPAAAEHGWKVGDEVFCYLDNRPGGGYAEHVAARAGLLARKPAGISHEEAAGVPLAAITALQSLRDLGRLQAGQHVLINGASGGVGIFAVQIVKALGGRATGVCSGRNVAFVRELGADRVIDYTQEDFTRLGEQYDLVFDAVAKSSYWKSRRVLTPHGRYVTTLPSPQSLVLQAATKLYGRRCLNILARPRGEDLRLIGHWIDDGRIRPIIDQVFPLERAAEAHRTSQQERARGKLVLRVT